MALELNAVYESIIEDATGETSSSIPVALNTSISSGSTIQQSQFIRLQKQNPLCRI